MKKLSALAVGMLLAVSGLVLAETGQLSSDAVVKTGSGETTFKQGATGDVHDATLTQDITVNGTKYSAGKTYKVITVNNQDIPLAGTTVAAAPVGGIATAGVTTGTVLAVVALSAAGKSSNGVAATATQ